MADSPGKWIVGSKTFWLNLLGTAVLLQPMIPVNAKWGPTVLAVLNIANRFVTTTPVTLLPPETP